MLMAGSLSSKTISFRALVAIIMVAAIVLVATAALRGTEYDENYTVFLASGQPRPHWPETPFRAGDARAPWHGTTTPLRIARDLRQTDVHPPLYFWAASAWRSATGASVFDTRLLSVVFSLGALAVLARIAVLCAVPPVATLLIALGCYGFTYTGAIARGFALAELLTLLGVWLLLVCERRDRAAVAFAAGLLLGLATFTNYLAAFVGSAALLWLLLARWRRPRLWLSAGIGFALVLPADMWFFLAQKGSRVGQFPPFRLLPSLDRLGQYAAANVLGGLPLYVPDAVRPVASAVLALGFLALLGLVAWRFRHLGRPGARILLAMAAMAPAVGLVLLGFVFDNTPIELRYIAFATPFLAALAAGALATLRRPLGLTALGLLLCVQLASLIGMMTQQATMQPQRATAEAAAKLAGPDGLVLLPRGNDGVGVVGAFISESPDWLHLLVIPRGTSPEAIRSRVGDARRVVLALLGVDVDSRATLPELERAFGDQACWRESGRGFDTVAFDRGC
jgi:4-amino-4-deoxy-L-arabinose transferase-like glycosyltransferase